MVIATNTLIIMPMAIPADHYYLLHITVTPIKPSVQGGWVDDRMAA